MRDPGRAGTDKRSRECVQTLPEVLAQVRVGPSEDSDELAARREAEQLGLERDKGGRSSQQQLVVHPHKM